MEDIANKRALPILILTKGLKKPLHFCANCLPFVQQRPRWDADNLRRAPTVNMTLPFTTLIK